MLSFKLPHVACRYHTGHHSSRVLHFPFLVLHLFTYSVRKWTSKSMTKAANFNDQGTFQCPKRYLYAMNRRLALTGLISISHIPTLVVTTWLTPSIVFPDKPYNTIKWAVTQRASDNDVHPKNLVLYRFYNYTRSLHTQEKPG